MSISDINRDLATRIQYRRDELNLTQLELALELGVSVRTVQNWESGDYYPRAKHRRALQRFFTETVEAPIPTEGESR